MMDFLFAAAAGSAITHGLLKRMNNVELEDIEEKLQQVQNYHVRGNDREAISILEQLRRKYPLYPDIYINLWGVYARIASIEKNEENAVLAADKALECHEAILWLVKQGAFVQQDILEGLQEHRASLTMIKDVATGKLKIVDDSAREYADKAYLAKEAGNYREALKWIGKAIKAETNDVCAALYHVRRAVIRNALDDDTGTLGDCKIALRCKGLDNEAREIAERIQNSVKARQYYQKSYLAVETKDANKALQYITKAIELETNDGLIAVYLAQRAMAKGVLGDYAGASSDCKKALRYKGIPAKLRETVVDIQRSAQDGVKSTTGKGRTRTKANVKKTRKRVAQSPHQNGL